jgi:hypothetical protein
MTTLTIENLASGTIPQIKEWCSNNNFKYPYKLKKADAVEKIKTEYNKKQGFNNDTAVSTISNGVVNKPAESKSTVSVGSNLTVETLEKGTVTEIKNWAGIKGFQVPSGLKKENLVDYLKGLNYEKDNNIIHENANSEMKLDELVPIYADPNMKWQDHLSVHGFAVVPINGWDTKFVDTFLKWFESCNSNFKSDDPSTWLTKNMPIQLHGILKHYFGHTELQWQIRELCAPIFAEIWKCTPEELLCSFDGGCFLPAKEKRTKNKSWIHVDQSRYQLDFQCVQGVVNFVENGPEDGGFVFVEKTHNYFAEYMKRYPSEGIKWGPINMADENIKKSRICKVCAPAGSIILFDSRLFHCNVSPSGSKLRSDGTPRFRMATYVSMQPRKNATDSELKKRVELYEKGRLTGHWCYGYYFDANPENPYARGGHNNKPEVIEIAQLNPLRKKLIGYQ